MANITKEEFEAFVKREFPGRQFKWIDDDEGSYCYIQAGTGKYSADELHYEFIDGRVRLHIEGDNWWELRQNLYNRLSRHPELQGAVWNKRQNCQWILKVDKKDIFEMFRRIRDVVEPEILAYEAGESLESSRSGDVTFETKSIGQVYQLSLNIPSYQRIYTWQREQVETLLEDIANIITKEYHIGTIVLHKVKSTRIDRLEEQMFYDVVDGQQRLVTLALIQYVLNPDNPQILKFLECKYSSNEAMANVHKNYKIIEEYLQNSPKTERIKGNIAKLRFGVLTIKNEKLDLAFKFFQNTNSKGKALSDYDLLKPHHLRYIPLELEDQQLHLATKWDSMIRNGLNLEKNNRDNIDYIRVLELYIYRLRKWSMLNECDTSISNYIKKEYEAAEIISELPPFGEQFHFNEPIQGGQHFFAFVDHFIQKYNEFHQKEMIQGAFGFSGSHSWYGLVIEGLLFCYFLKFGNSYIYEAALSIIRYISIIRFRKGRAYEPTILRWAQDSKIVLLIQRATSPTFFLASVEKLIDNVEGNEVEDATDGIRKSFYNICIGVSVSIKERKLSSLNYYSDYSNRYNHVKTSNS